MNIIRQISLLAGGFLCLTPAYTQTTDAGTPPAQKPMVAVPLFVNGTGEHMTRIAPGKYKEKNVRVGTDSRHELSEEDGKRVNTSSTRDVYEKQLERLVEYAPGEYALPDAASTVAADAATDAIVRSGHFRILARSTPVLELLNNERAFAGTGTAASAESAFQSLVDMGATYVLYGSINNFRINENKGEAYNVRRWQVTTTVNLDLKLVDVSSNEIVASRNMTTKSVLNIPEGMSQVDSMYDWEAALRAAVTAAMPDFLKDIDAGFAAQNGTPVVETITLQVNSTPAGADIDFNGNFVGNTPATVTVPNRSGTLTLTLEGYKPWSRKLVPTEGMSINPTLGKYGDAPTPIQPEINIIK